MLHGQNYIGNTLTSETNKSFKTFNPILNKKNEFNFYEASKKEILDAVNLAQNAFQKYKLTSGKARASFLEAIVEEILLIQEKIVETAADKLVIITDASKQVNDLGAFDLPVEVVKFGWETTKRLIKNVLIDQDVDCRIVTRRKNASPVITDENHYILDLKLNRIGNPEKLSQSLLNIAGVVETGLFLNMTDSIIMGDATGLARVKSNGASEWDDTNYDIKELSEFITNIKNI